MKILSLFDGISIAQQAFKDLGYNPQYYASEIDKQAIFITQKNHPNTIQIGDIRKINILNGYLCYGKERIEADFDYIIGGSPCQDLSIAKNNRKGLKGERSSLFWEYARILKNIKPHRFIFENVASMPKEAKDTITETLWGIEPIILDASLFSAQQRKRLFWIGKLLDGAYTKVSILPTENKKLYLKDILEPENLVDEKRYQPTNYQKDFANKDKPIRIGTIGNGSQGDRIYSIQGKSVCLSANGGGRGAKTGLYLIGDYCRPLTPIECERLQGLPDDYTKGLSKTIRKKLLGNGFNCDVIKHIIKSITKEVFMKRTDYKTVIPVTDKTNEQLKDIRAILWTKGHKIISQKEAIGYITDKFYKELLQEIDKELQNVEEIESK